MVGDRPWLLCKPEEGEAKSTEPSEGPRELSGHRFYFCPSSHARIDEAVPSSTGHLDKSGGIKTDNQVAHGKG